MNWSIFETKYNNEESDAFERMSYLLFCAEFNNRIGLFRYKNQIGIETEPIERDGKYYGFQAKYYSTNISTNKSDIIDSIIKAKKKNSLLSEIYLYVNKELSESKNKNQKQPKYQLDIETAASEIGVNIQWRVPSHFEVQLEQPENKYIYNIFFNLNPNEESLLEEIYKHNDNILKTIHTEMYFQNQRIKIDRQLMVQNIEKLLEKNKNVILTGEGGSGKTAILKEFYQFNTKNIPVCIFKATELNVNNINEIFNFESEFTFKKFLDVYKDEKYKVFVIDSAEKLAEIKNNDIIFSLIQALKENSWNIIFTTRTVYLNDLTFHLRENFNLLFETINIPLISREKLENISEKYNLTLPKNQKFLERIKNLFYLNEFIKHYNSIDKKSNLASFTDLLWKKRIQNNIEQSNNINIKRERCLIEIAKRRCESGGFYVNGDDLSQDALFKLKQDEILGYDELYNGYFITHDIYEEWALNKIVSRSFYNYTNIDLFFQELGDSLPIRRAFRSWLFDKLEDIDMETKEFIQEIFIYNKHSEHWKDEALVSVLLSDYSDEFFNIFEEEIVKDDFKMLKRIIFLLRIACTNILSDGGLENRIPNGNGWNTVIKFIHKYKSDFLLDNLTIILPVLLDWSVYQKKGLSTKYAGLIALDIMEEFEKKEKLKFTEKENDIFKILYNSSIEIEFELKGIFEKCIKNKWVNYNDPYYEFCTNILEKPYSAYRLIEVLPEYIRQLCEIFWMKNDNDHSEFYFDKNKLEHEFGLSDNYKFTYFPASANQTPIIWLLHNDFHDTLDFIINFTNNAIDIYRQSKNKIFKINLNVDREKVIQYVNQPVWDMYRGFNGGIPNLLQSIHMALEEFLLKNIELIDQKLLIYILKSSKSASLTAVVSSIVLAYPSKFYEVSLHLFKTIEFFQLDNIRKFNESLHDSIYSIGYGMNKLNDFLYTDERLRSLKYDHRNTSLEELFLKYQLFGVQGFSEEQNYDFLKKLYQIIDSHKLNNSLNMEYNSLLERIDRRNLIPEITRQDSERFRVEFRPKNYSDKDRKETEKLQENFNSILKYSSLRNWAYSIIDSNRVEFDDEFEKFNENPYIALRITKQLMIEMEKEDEVLLNMNTAIPSFSCSKLLINHADILRDEDKEFCKRVVFSTLSTLFEDEYSYQLNDGIEACIHALPSIIKEFPDTLEECMTIMTLALLDDTPIGNYKRVCDYVIESIHNSNLWETNPDVVQSILFEYIKIVPHYRKILLQLMYKSTFGTRRTRRSVLEELDKSYSDFAFMDLSFNLEKISYLDIQSLEVVFKLIPADTEDKTHLSIYEKTLPDIAQQLLESRRQDEKGSNLYLIRLSIFKSFAKFILQRKLNEIETYLIHFRDSLKGNEEAATLIGEFIFAEDKLKSYDQFWYVWNLLFPRIKYLCNQHNKNHIREIIINYLLAWRWWNDDIEKWSSLTHDNLNIYYKASKEIGSNPSVLYSIARVLNTIGSNFQEEGIEWIYTITVSNRNLNLNNQESDTLYNLEIFLRKFVFVRKEKIKTNIRLKNKILSILNFMIERGSIHGYLLREEIL